MATATVRISKESHAKLVALAVEHNRPMGAVLADLIERERRRLFLEGANRDFACLRTDPEAWADYWAEHQSMECTLMDGLKDDPWYA